MTVGPVPKHPSALKNPKHKGSTHRVLHELPNDIERKVPPLIKKEGGWQPQTMAWWEDLWSSPMSSEYDDSDVHGLFLLADLMDQYWQHPTTVLAAEIRLQRQCFGLTPIDRRRLQWEIQRGETAEDQTRERRKRKNSSANSGVDPRQSLAN